MCVCGYVWICGGVDVQEREDLLQDRSCARRSWSRRNLRAFGPRPRRTPPPLLNEGSVRNGGAFHTFPF